MSLQTRLGDLIVAIATDYKQIRTWLTGSASGDLTTLTTTDKTSIVNAINEVKAGNSGAPPSATEAVSGVVELATLTEVAAGVDTSRAVTAAGVRQERIALKDEILGGVGPAFDTLMELSTQLQNDTDAITALNNQIADKANSADVYTKLELGDPETDLVAAYTAAKA